MSNSLAYPWIKTTFFLFYRFKGKLQQFNGCARNEAIVNKICFVLQTLYRLEIVSTIYKIATIRAAQSLYLLLSGRIMIFQMRCGRELSFCRQWLFSKLKPPYRWFYECYS